VLGRNLWLLLLLSALVVGLPTGVMAVAQMSTLSLSPTEPFSTARVAISLGGVFVSLACNAVLQAAVIHATVTDLAGRRVTFGESLAMGLRFFLPLVGISIIAGVGCMIGAIFFIVPGVLLGLALIVAAPAEVMERVGVFGALGRSVELTRNHRGVIFALVIIYVFILWIIQAVFAVFAAVVIGSTMRSVSAPPGELPGGMMAVLWVQAALNLVVTTLLSSLSSVGIASIYFELRETKEGVGAEQLAAVFD
jgi:hypothetical protein